MIKSISYGFAPLPVVCSIYLGESVEELRKKLDVSVGENCRGFCTTDGNGNVKIAILHDSPLDHIVHETAHATFFMLAYPGMEIYTTTGTHEMFCYYQQYLFKRVVEFQQKVRKQFRGNKKKL